MSSDLCGASSDVNAVYGKAGEGQGAFLLSCAGAVVHLHISTWQMAFRWGNKPEKMLQNQAALKPYLSTVSIFFSLTFRKIECQLVTKKKKKKKKKEKGKI